jgi:hypothetical protein
MPHPHAAHRQSIVEHSRAKRLTKGYAHGGAVPANHPDEKADVKLVKKLVKPNSLRMHGGKVKHRADKRARGGKVKHKGTTVNIINASHPNGPGAGPMMPPGGMPMPPPHPPMPPMGAPPMGAAGPPGMPPGGMPPPGGAPGMPPRPPMMPPGMPMRARGGSVKDGPAWKEGVKNGTQPTHTPGKSDLGDMFRGKPVTYARGGKIESPQGVDKATKLPGGSGGGEARLVKEKRARRDYKAA